ncbi:PAAR domain-containing protein [Glaciimonas immobilis]|uniref:Putative Zn-binding protein involved in type VI secretion n=1 Tax=Glaciimonas immobilis TaxID=728004 RepID=A0A840RR79_9BURK|nr:PAAR domain-containing protein [Glaciimonas immobilis]KAF3997382.1 PAAR domain-containing protein [Glaciimonas immobilis]MBB5200957.1 putative Zn-binding protein involved in type VI secretion [Glaciimonas immobilis]
MAKRYYILIGDLTTAKGFVTEGLSTNRCQGRHRAYEGDKIDCRSCKSTGIIRCSGTRISNTGSHGKEAALDGDLCICKCDPPPRLIASQSTFYTEGYAALSGLNFGNAEKNDALGNAGSDYDQHFVMVDSVSLHAVEHVVYGLKSASEEHHGGVDAEGKTVESYSSTSDKIDLLYAVQTRLGVDRK